MGYYDDFDDRPRKSRGGRGFFYAFIGAILGSLLVLVSLPLLIQWGVVQLPTQDVNRGQGGASDSPSRQGGTPTPVQTMNVNINSAVADVVSKVENSIVGVVNLQQSDDFWTRKSDVIQQGTGSGVIFTQKGNKVYVVTNHHVIEGAARIEVVLADGNRVSADLEGSDSLSDLAVLSFTKTDLPITPVPFGNSDRLRPGDPAIAIGNPLGLDYSRTVTVGVISSTDRSIPLDLDGDGYTDWEMDVIQTDAAINPGNSGGALIDIAGQLVGINSAKISEVGIEGMGFAIPINEASPIISDLMNTGSVKRPFLGIGPKDLQEIDRSHWQSTLNLPADVHLGVVVVDVTSGAPADKGGMKELDVIVKLDDQPIGSSAELRKYLYKEKKIGEPIRVTFYRDGKLQETSFNLGSFTP
ncbi:Uncharacterized serine protease YyxA [[Clostridium] ultunense Esp]|nr:Uncharacterized serine protease YyxA [[Clostridium] ultunense Esp]